MDSLIRYLQRVFAAACRCPSYCIATGYSIAFDRRAILEKQIRDLNWRGGHYFRHTWHHGTGNRKQPSGGPSFSSGDSFHGVPGWLVYEPSRFQAKIAG